jgi:3-oxoacyl-[acyl-carrier-protein] synthase III
MFTAIQIAQVYLASGRANCALVVSGEYITHLTKTAQQEIAGFKDERLACLTLGDAGAGAGAGAACAEAGVGAASVASAANAIRVARARRAGRAERAIDEVAGVMVMASA